MRQRFILIVSGTYPNEKAYTWYTSARLPFRRTLMSCLTGVFDFLGLILGALQHRSVTLAQLPNQLSQWLFSLRQDDGSFLPRLILTLLSHSLGSVVWSYLLRSRVKEVSFPAHLCVSFTIWQFLHKCVLRYKTMWFDIILRIVYYNYESGEV